MPIEVKDAFLLGIAIVSCLIAVLTFAWNRHNERAARFLRITGERNVEELRQANELREAKRRAADELASGIERRIGLLETSALLIPGMITKVDLFWSLVETTFPKLLMHDDSPTRDALLAKMTNRTLTAPEALELKALLEVDLAHGEMSDADRLTTYHVVKRAELIAMGVPVTLPMTPYPTTVEQVVVIGPASTDPPDPSAKP